MDNSGSRYQSQSKDKSPYGRGDRNDANLYQRSAARLEPHRGQRTIEEEDQYHRRREEEIKRHIHQKETEIQNLARASDILRIRMEPPPIQPSQRGPADINAKYASFGRQQPEKDHSAYNSGKQREEQMPPHIREHIANIQSDNSSLMRRLNLVLQELERVQKEKDELYGRLQSVTKESNDIQKIISCEDNVDKANRYLQDDLAYERDRNLKTRQQIKEEDIQRNELLRELKKVQSQQDEQALMSQDQSSELQKKLNHIQDIEKEHYFTHEKVKQLNLAIEQAKLELLHENDDKIDIQRVLDQLVLERTDLLNRLDNLTFKYDDCVREISHDRAEMESHNKRHSKLVTAKIIFTELENIARNRKRQGFENFKSYCQFDNKCHGKLQTLSKVMMRCGQYRLQIALHQWYTKALRPTKCRLQSMNLTEKVYKDHLKRKMFYRWIKRYQNKTGCYDVKSKAIQAVWDIKVKDANIEKKRAFSIWKDALEKAKLQKQKVKKLIWRLYFNRLSDSFNQWTNHKAAVDTQVRLNLLKQQFAHKQYLTILFHSFRYQTTESRRKRQNILLHYVKGWKDYIERKKYIMSASICALQYQKQTDNNILRQCFDALKVHKETEKFTQAFECLNDNIEPKIEELNKELSQKKEELTCTAKSRGLGSIKAMMGKRLHSYLMKWKMNTDNYRVTLNTKVKDRIIKVYLGMLRVAFAQWKVARDGSKIQQQAMVVFEQQEEGQAMQSEVMAVQKEIKDKREQLDCSSKRGALKCVTSFNRRLMQIAIGRWRDQMTTINVKEGGAETVIKRIRTRMLRQAFDLYLEGVKSLKKTDVEEERCKYYNRTRDERLKVKVFNQWLIYKNNFVKAKNYWARIYKRIDNLVKERAMKKWREGGQRKLEQMLESSQNEVVQEMSVLNTKAGHLAQMDESQRTEITNINGKMKKQAQRIIANAFARFYDIGQARGFSKWREYVEHQQRKEKIMKKMLNHWKMYQFQHVKNCFKTWILQANINERKEFVKKEEMRIADTEHVFNMQSKQFANQASKLKAELEDAKAKQAIFNSRLQKTIGMIVVKVDGNDYMSQKRYILQQWRDYVKRQKLFIHCTINVIQKSLWNIGFAQIKNCSRKVQREQKVSTVMDRFRMKFWKRTCGTAFSTWRSGMFKTMMQTIEETCDETNMLVEEHTDFRTKAKEANSDRADQILVKNRLKNLFSAWKNVIQFLKLQNTKADFCQNNVLTFQKKCAIFKWKKRKDATRLARLRVERLREKFQKIRLRMVFYAMRGSYSNSKNLVSRLSNFEHIHNHQGLKQAFIAIQSYSRSKNYVHKKKKENSTKDIYSMLGNLLKRRMTTYFGDLKYRTMNKNKQDLHKILTIMHSLSNRSREYFNRWKVYTNNHALKEEMHDEGPIREQVFEQKQFLENCKNFMREEGYSEHDIEEALKNGKHRQNTLLLKGVRRMQHYNDDLYLKPKMFDRWRQFVHLKKLFRYWLSYASKRSEHIKSDLAKFFDRWKNYDANQKQSLSKLSKKELDLRMIKNSQTLDKLAEQMQDHEQYSDHLNGQKEALLDYYIKGQKLALSLWINNKKRLMHSAFKLWAQNSIHRKNEDMEVSLRKNIDLIAALKDKLRLLENDNDGLANENEELRQFSLDGYEIAKNVQALTAEREKLSVDLADKAQTIRKLLEENEKLTSNLRSAQDEAQSLIKSTSKFMASTGGGLAFQSPAMRNSNYY